MKAGSPTPQSSASLVRNTRGDYTVNGSSLSEDVILAAADEIIERRFFRMASLTTMAEAKRFLRAKLITRDREEFGCLFIDGHHRVIAWEILFRGTLTTCAVHPREVVKRALHYNCGGVILAHQHPSGDPEPSRADKDITLELKAALALVDIQLLDHIVIGARREVSLGECGLL